MPPRSNNPTGRATFRAVRASLGLVEGSSESLTASQLLALRRELHKALTIIDRRIQRTNAGMFIENPLELQLTSISQTKIWSSTYPTGGPHQMRTKTVTGVGRTVGTVLFFLTLGTRLTRIPANTEQDGSDSRALKLYSDLLVKALIFPVSHYFRFLPAWPTVDELVIGTP